MLLAKTHHHASSLRGLIFIHGCPDSPATWQGQEEYFQHKFNIYMPDLKQMVIKKKIHQGQTPKAMAKKIKQHLVLAFPDTQIEWTVVGHDIGGELAYQLLLCSTQIKALVLINSLTLGQFRMRLWSFKQWLRSWYVLLAQVPAIDKTFDQLSSVLKMYLKQGGNTNADVKSLEHFLPYYKSYFKSYLKGEVYEKLSCPTYQIFSDKDLFLEAPSLDELKSLSSLKCFYQRLEGDHWVHEKKSHQINLFIEEFLQRNVWKLKNTKPVNPPVGI